MLRAVLSNIKYEFIRLYTVRSTYIAAILALAFSAIVVITSVIEYNGKQGEPQGGMLAAMMLDTPVAAALIAAVIAILFVAHEYRYNTIMYTLTASRSRLKVLLAKTLPITLYAAVLGALCVGFGLALYHISVAIKGVDMPPQNFDVMATFLRAVGYVTGMALLGFIIAALVRNIIFAIVALFLLPAVVEPLLSIVLKDNAMYLPFMSLIQIVLPAGTPDAILSPAKAALVLSAYLVAGWIISYVLLLRRDAN
jgi:ABC-2 type transport system permease protein